MAGQMWDLAATPIGQAIKAGDVNDMNRLVKEGENVFFKDRKQNTYLHYVSTMYRPSVFYALVAHGLDVSAQNRHGNTALHVTALQKECCHVSDLMTCGVDSAIKNKEGKTADKLNNQNKYWHMIFDRYKPGIFQAVRDHDIPKIHQLLRCWCRVDVVYKRQNLRQIAALLKFHDIVVIIDQHQPTTDMIYGVFEGNHDKVREALKMTRCKVNFLNEISAKKHILQYAIKFRDLEFVKMLCDAGADVNIRVQIHHYFWGPLYFEAFHKDTPIEILWYILKAGADFSLKDERGRNAFMYALDKINGELPVTIFQYMLKKGIDITERDCTGCTPRDIARFARRRDVVDLIDKYYVKIIRSSDCNVMTTMAIDGYDGLMITHNYRDTFIYASGNRSGDVLQLIEWLPEYQSAVKRIHDAIRNGSADDVSGVLHSCVTPELVVRGRNKARRTPLIEAVLRCKGDVVSFLIELPYDLDINAKDCCNRTAFHFACCLTSETGETIKKQLLDTGADNTIEDVRGQIAESFGQRKDSEHFIQKETKAVYGMTLELICCDKYEELRKIVRSRKKGLTEFVTFIRSYRFPVAALHKVLKPLMPKYRDLIFLAIDHGKEDIAYKLADLGADLCRKEQYESTNDDDVVENKWYTAAERASRLGMHDLAEYLQEKHMLQLERVRHQLPLLPKRAFQKHFQTQYGSTIPSVFITQSFVI